MAKTVEHYQGLEDEVTRLRALVGGPRKEELKVPGKTYCRHCGVEIYVPRMNESRLGPTMHAGTVPYLQCKMLTHAEFEDGEGRPMPQKEVRAELDSVKQDFDARLKKALDGAWRKVLDGTPEGAAIGQALRENGFS